MTRWDRSPGLDGLSDELLRSIVAIDQAYPMFVTTETSSERKQHLWKEAILADRPELARDAYLALTRATLHAGDEYIEGLWALLNDEPFAPFRDDIVVELLREFPSAPTLRLGELLRAGITIQRAHPELLTLARDVISCSITVEAEQRDRWLAAAYFLSPGEFETAVEADTVARRDFVFLLRDFSGYEFRNRQALGLPMSQLEFLASLTGRLFPEAPFPSSGWWGRTNRWDASEFMRYLVNAISALPTEAATAALVRLEADDRLSSYRPHIRHALASQRAGRREAEYDRPDWPRTLRALENRAPASVSDLHALLVAHLDDLRMSIAAANTDTYKRFWNENRYGRIETPKPEESCRDVLVGLLRPRLLPLGITVEPEGHMVSDGRADISVAMPGRKILCELKRDYHVEVWSAAEQQLDRFYTIDPEAKGFGIYGVFWFGDKRPRLIPRPPNGRPLPQSAAELEQMLLSLVPEEKRNRLAVVVFDVSGAH